MEIQKKSQPQPQIYEQPPQPQPIEQQPQPIEQPPQPIEQPPQPIEQQPQPIEQPPQQIEQPIEQLPQPIEQPPQQIEQPPQQIEQQPQPIEQQPQPIEQPIEQQTIEQQTIEQPQPPTPEEKTEDENKSTEEEIQDEEFLALSIREKQIRSKILNRKPQCQIKQEEESSSMYVEKVTLKTSVTDIEEHISELLKSNKQIHPFLQYQPIIETTPITLGSIKIENCDEDDMNEISTEQTTNLLSIKYKKLTTTLSEYLVLKKSDIKPKNHFLSILLTSHLQLLDAIEKLQQLETPIIHFNINEQTILYDTINATPVLSDFRMAMTTTDIDTDEIFQN